MPRKGGGGREHHPATARRAAAGDRRGGASSWSRLSRPLRGMVGFTDFNGGGRGHGLCSIEQPFEWPAESGTAEPGPDLKEDRLSTAAAAGVPAREWLVLDLWSETLTAAAEVFHKGQQEALENAVRGFPLLLAQPPEGLVGLPPHLRRGRAHLPGIPPGLPISAISASGTYVPSFLAGPYWRPYWRLPRFL